MRQRQPAVPELILEKPNPPTAGGANKCLEASYCPRRPDWVVIPIAAGIRHAPAAANHPAARERIEEIQFHRGDSESRGKPRPGKLRALSVRLLPAPPGILTQGELDHWDVGCFHPIGIFHSCIHHAKSGGKSFQTIGWLTFHTFAPRFDRSTFGFGHEPTEPSTCELPLPVNVRPRGS